MADDPVRKMMEIMPSEWDKAPVSIALEIGEFLENVKDADTKIDSGTDGQTGDIWVTIQGVEYYVSVRKSHRQLVKEGK